MLSREILKKGVIEVEGSDGIIREIAYEGPAQRLQAAHMVAGGTLIKTTKTLGEDDKVIEHKDRFILADEYYPTKRVKAMDNMMEPQKQYVIFTAFIHERELLVQHFKERATGSLEALRKGEAQVAVLSIKSYSMGVNLAWLSGGVLFYSLHWSGAVHCQVLDRQLKFDRDVPALTWVPLLTGGVDQYVFNTVSKKEEFNLDVYKTLQRRNKCK